METRFLGRTGIRVSPLCLGCMMFGGRTSPSDSEKTIDRAHIDRIRPPGGVIVPFYQAAFGPSEHRW